MASNQKIYLAIWRATGYQVKVEKSQGLTRFQPADICKEDQGIDFSLFESEYIPNLNMLTAAEWGRRFIDQLKETGQPLKRGRAMPNETKHQNSEAMQGNKNASKDPDDRAEAVLHVRCTREQKNAYVKAAQADGVRLASWAKSILDQAIKERSQ